MELLSEVEIIFLIWVTLCNLPFISHIFQIQKIKKKKKKWNHVARKLYLTRIKSRIKMALMDIPPVKYVRILRVQLRRERWVKLKAIYDLYIKKKRRP